MKICQIMLCKGYGGAERAFVDTCQALAHAGHQVHAVVVKDFYGLPQLQHTNITITIVTILARFDPLARYHIKKALIQYQAHIVHIHLRRSMILAADICKKLGLPVIATVHNYSKANAYMAADRVIALTDDHAKHLANYPEFMGKIDILSNFSRFKPTTATIPQQHSLKFLAYGRFIHKKGFDLLIDAFAKTHNTMPHAQLTIVGAGVEADKLQQQIVQCKLEAVCQIEGWTDNICDLLDRHHVFVLPSRSEPFGIVVLEAMARNKVIISTLCEGPRQFLSDDTCFFCKLDDVDSMAIQLTNVSQHRQLAQKKADQANQCYRQQFYVDVVIPKLLAIYQNML